jgi:hypothetical protein
MHTIKAIMVATLADSIELDMFYSKRANGLAQPVR